MVRLVLRKQKSDYAEDVARIVSVCAAKGYEISGVAAAQAWSNYSDSMAAGWMVLPDGDYAVLYIVLCFTEEDVERDDERAG